MIYTTLRTKDGKIQMGIPFKNKRALNSYLKIEKEIKEVLYYSNNSLDIVYENGNTIQVRG